MTTKEIIHSILQYEDISASSFAKKIGIHPTQIYDLQSGKTKRISASIGNKILSINPNYNLSWLLTGEGNMLNNSSNAKEMGSVYSVSEKDDEVVTVDFVPISAHATFIENLEINSSEFDKISFVPNSSAERLDAEKYKVFEVEGSSMSPTLADGALILAKEIPEKSWHYAEGVVVAVYSEFVVVKRVLKNDLLSGNTLVLGSDNEKYGQMTIPLSDIRAIYKAKRIISSDII